MEIKASIKYLRIAPRKTRLVVDFIRGMNCVEAKAKLCFLNKRSSEPILKLLDSAISNAKDLGLDEKKIKDLFIKTIFVDEGPKLKRSIPVSRGSAHSIHKKTSHISLILEEKNSKTEKTEKTEKSEKTEKTEKIGNKENKENKDGYKKIKTKEKNKKSEKHK